MPRAHQHSHCLLQSLYENTSLMLSLRCLCSQTLSQSKFYLPHIASCWVLVCDNKKSNYLIYTSNKEFICMYLKIQ